METGYKILRLQRRVKKRTRTRTSGTRRRGREKGSKNKSTIQRELLAKRELLAEGMLATEIMDQEIARLGELMTLLYPWDEDGKQITGKSVNAYYWASERVQAAGLNPVRVQVDKAGKIEIITAATDAPGGSELDRELADWEGRRDRQAAP